MEVVKFFSFKTEGIYYRPLSVQLVTFLARGIFGLRPAWFHLIGLILHLLAVAVVYKLIKKLTDDDRLALVGGVFYGVHPVHFMSIFWWAEVSMVMAPLFAFLALLNWLNNKQGKFLLFLLLGLLSNELAISVVGIAWLLRRDLRKLIPAGLMGGVIVGGRWLIAPPFLGAEYGLKFSLQLALANLRWQIIRAVGFIEGFWGQLSSPLVVMSVIFISLAAVWLIGMGGGRKIKLTPLFFLGLAWFGLAVMPVVFLQHHQSPIYQIIGLPGFFLALSQILKPQSDKLVTVWLGLFVLGSLLGIRGMEKYHWVTLRAKEANYYIDKLEQRQAKDGEAVVFINSQPEASTRAYFALGAGNGVKVWFGDKTQVYFEDFGLPGDLLVKTHYITSNFSP